MRTRRYVQLAVPCCGTERQDHALLMFSRSCALLSTQTLSIIWEAGKRSHFSQSRLVVDYIARKLQPRKDFKKSGAAALITRSVEHY